MKYISIFTGLVIVQVLYSLDLSLRITPNNSLSLLWNPSSGRPLCYPTDEMMGLIDDQPFRNFSVSMQRVGQVFCRQLHYSYMESIGPIASEPTFHSILWMGKCKGFEPTIHDCKFEEVNDPSKNCTELVGLNCGHCGKNTKLGINETLRITSPGYPKMYHDTGRCDWTISTKSATTTNKLNVFEVTIQHLVLPQRDHFGKCRTGYLEIQRKTTEIKKLTTYHTLCGHSRNKTLIVNGTGLHLRWHAGIFHPRPDLVPGFDIIIKTSSVVRQKVSGQILTTSSSGSSSLPLGSIVGVVIGIIASLGIVIGAVYWSRIKLGKLRRTRRRKRMASSLFLQRVREDLLQNETSLNHQPSDQTENQVVHDRRKSSVTSIIYEDLDSFNRNLQGSYVFLDECPRRSSSPSAKMKDGKRRDSSSFEFIIPKVEVTSYCSDSRISSGPSDMPSELTLNSDLNSVFGSEANISFNCPRSILGARNNTYIVSEKSSSRYSLGACTQLFPIRKGKKVSDVSCGLSQRYSSEPNVTQRKNEENFTRMQSGSFIPSHVLSEP